MLLMRAELLRGQVSDKVNNVYVVIFYLNISQLKGGGGSFPLHLHPIFFVQSPNS